MYITRAFGITDTRSVETLSCIGLLRDFLLTALVYISHRCRQPPTNDVTGVVIQDVGQEVLAPTVVEIIVDTFSATGSPIWLSGIVGRWNIHRASHSVRFRFSLRVKIAAVLVRISLKCFSVFDGCIKTRLCFS